MYALRARVDATGPRRRHGSCAASPATKCDATEPASGCSLKLRTEARDLLLRVALRFPTSASQRGCVKTPFRGLRGVLDPLALLRSRATARSDRSTFERRRVDGVSEGVFTQRGQSDAADHRHAMRRVPRDAAKFGSMPATAFVCASSCRMRSRERSASADSPGPPCVPPCSDGADSRRWKLARLLAPPAPASRPSS